MLAELPIATNSALRYATMVCNNDPLYLDPVVSDSNWGLTNDISSSKVPRLCLGVITQRILWHLM